jgi:hypothetical protein
MATMDDLHDVLISVETAITAQAGILTSILNLQQSEALLNEAERQRNAASRTATGPGPNPPSGPGGGRPGPTPPAQDNSLSGLLGGLTALFGKNILGKFSILATGAAALAVTVGASIGIISGQMTAISTYFKVFGVDFPKIFADFKTSISTKFLAIVDDLAIRTAFIRVAITDALDNFANSVRNLFDPNTAVGKVLITIKNALDTLMEPFKTALTTLQELAGPTGQPSKIAQLFTTIKTWFGEIGAKVARIAKVVGKLFAPIAIIMTAWDTITGALDGYAEGGILGGFKGAIDGFFTSLVTIPLDLIKDMIAWVLKKLGFDESAEVLGSFSFTDLWKQLTGAIFSGIEGAINVIKDLFTFGEEDKTALGLLGKFTDLIYAPVNMAINFVRGLFGFEETDEPFKLQDWITEKATAIFSWLGAKFSEFADYIMTIPEQIRIAAQTMWIDVKEKLKLGFLDLAEWISSLPAKILASIINILDAAAFTIPDNKATRFFGIDGAKIGFVDEDVVKAANAAANAADPAIAERRAEIIDTANAERESLAAELRQIEERAMASSSPTIVVNAPNNSTTTVSQTGGNSQASMNNYGGGGSSDLNPGATVPGGVGGF